MEIIPITIKEYIKKAHKNSIDKGFYEKDKNIGEMLMLIVSELSEALEAHRKNRIIDTKSWIEHQRCFHLGINEKSTKKDINNAWFKAFELTIKDTFEDEIADVFIRLFDLCGYLRIDIEKHIDAKMKYNEFRSYKHGKEY